MGIKAMPVTRLSRVSSEVMPLVIEFNVETALADLASGESLLPGSQMVPCRTGKDGGLSGVSMTGYRVCS